MAHVMAHNANLSNYIIISSSGSQNQRNHSCCLLYFSSSTSQMCRRLTQTAGLTDPNLSLHALQVARLTKGNISSSLCIPMDAYKHHIWTPRAPTILSPGSHINMKVQISLRNSQRRHFHSDYQFLLMPNSYWCSFGSIISLAHNHKRFEAKDLWWCQITSFPLNKQQNSIFTTAWINTHDINISVMEGNQLKARIKEI